jgi:primosomal protein N' (replication factor Y)
MLVASVLLPMPLPEAFDYAVPDGMALSAGDQVAAPLGPRVMRGVVTALHERAGVNRPLKALVGKLDEAALPPGALSFIEWAARYACQSPGDALAMTLRGLRSPPPKPLRRLAASGGAPARVTPARTRVLEALAARHEPMRPGELAAAAGVSSGVV